MILLTNRTISETDRRNRYTISRRASSNDNGGRGRDGEHKKVILLTATPINNDLYDMANQLRLVTRRGRSYFRQAGIGDLYRLLPGVLDEFHAGRFNYGHSRFSICSRR